MGENGKRLGRTSTYSRRGWLAYLTGGGAIAVALLMALSPAATAASANLVLHAPYKGVTVPQNSISQSGCGKATETKKWHFSMKHGTGGSQSKGLASSCKKQIAGIGQTSSASTNGGFTIGLSLGKISPSATSVDANMTASWSMVLSASDGGRSPACNNAPSTDYYNYTEWEWNSFSNFAYAENGSYNGVPYNYSYNVASVPSPFNLNNTTYYVHESGFSHFAYCQAEASAFMEIYGYLIDLSTGVQMYASSNSFGSYGEVFDVFVEVINETDWGCSQFYEWDQGSTFGSNTSTCFSYNTTLTSEVTTYVPTYSTSVGSNNSVSWTNTSATTGDLMWTGPFSAGDHYALGLYVFMDASAYNGWQHGSASFSFNMATLGHGIKLNKVTIA